MNTYALDLASQVVGRAMLEKQRYDLVALTEQYEGKPFEIAGFKLVWDGDANARQIKIDNTFYAWLSNYGDDDGNRFWLALNNTVSAVNSSTRFKDASDVSYEEFVKCVQQIATMAKQLNRLIASLPKSVELNGFVFRLEKINNAVAVYKHGEQEFDLDLIDNEVLFDGFRQTADVHENVYKFSCTKNPKLVFEAVKKFMDEYHIRSDFGKMDRVLIGIGDKYDIEDYRVEIVKLSLIAPKESLKPFFDEVEQLARKHSFEISKG
jgi:hypothetical protein